MEKKKRTRRRHARERTRTCLSLMREGCKRERRRRGGKERTSIHVQESKGERRSTPKAFSPFLALRTREGGEEETQGQLTCRFRTSLNTKTMVKQNL